MAVVSHGAILSTLLVSARIFTLFGEYSSTVSQDTATFIFFLCGPAHWVQSSWDISNIGLTWYISFVSHTIQIWKQKSCDRYQKLHPFSNKRPNYFFLIFNLQKKEIYYFLVFHHEKNDSIFLYQLKVHPCQYNISKINKHCKWNAIRNFECQIDERENQILYSIYENWITHRIEFIQVECEPVIHWFCFCGITYWPPIFLRHFCAFCQA